MPTGSVRRSEVRGTPEVSVIVELALLALSGPRECRVRPVSSRPRRRASGCATMVTAGVADTNRASLRHATKQDNEKIAQGWSLIVDVEYKHVACLVNVAGTPCSKSSSRALSHARTHGCARWKHAEGKQIA